MSSGSILRSSAALLGCSLIFHGVAHSAEGNPSSFSLVEALRRAEAGNPALHAQAYATRSTDALIAQAGARPNPALSIALENFAGSGAFRGFDGIETTVQLGQVFERGGKRAKRVAVARSGREIASQEFAVRRAELLAAAAAAYVDVLTANSRTEQTARSLALARETAGVISTHVQAASTSSVESARARAALATARAEHTRAESTRAQTYASLAATWGGPPDDLPRVPGLPQVPGALPDREALLAQLSSHPRNELHQATIDARRAELQLARSTSAQDVTVAGGLRSLRASGDAAFVAGVSVPIAFRNQNEGAIRSARETLAGAEQSTRALDAELRAAFSAAWEALLLAHTVARDLRADALPAMEEALVIVRRAHTQGEASLLDVLDAHRALNWLNRDVLEAEAAFAAALVRLDSLTDPTFPLTSAFLSRR